MSKPSRSFLPDGEPSRLTDMYGVFGRAKKLRYAVEDVYPSILQTPDYAHTILSRGNAPEIIPTRLATRLGRNALFSAAGIASEVYIPEAVLTSQYYGTGPESLLRQLSHLEQVLAAGMEAGEDSRLRVGIVPANRFTPDFPGQSVIEATTRDGGIYVAARDGLLVSRLDGPEAQNKDIRNGVTLLSVLAANAVMGEAALDIVETNRAVLLDQE